MRIIFIDGVLHKNTDLPEAFEIDDKFKDCSRDDFNDDFTFNIEKYNARKQKESNLIIVNQLEEWFETFFDKQFKQSQWQKNFRVNKDPYFKDANGNPLTYLNIEELIQQAEIVRETINSLRSGV